MAQENIPFQISGVFSKGVETEIPREGTTGLISGSIQQWVGYATKVISDDGEYKRIIRANLRFDPTDEYQFDADATEFLFWNGEKVEKKPIRLGAYHHPSAQIKEYGVTFGIVIPQVLVSGSITIPMSLNQ